MRNILKSLIPDTLLQSLRAYLVQRNRRNICQLSHRTEQLLEPVNNVEHYYHFIFDLCLPLHLTLQAASPNAKFSLRDFGIFTERLPLLFPDRVKIVGKDHDTDGLTCRPLNGMNPVFMRLSRQELESFTSHVLTTLDIDSTAPPNKILLIERLPPESYFVNQATKKGGGASRRSIPNFQEFVESLQNRIQSPYELQTVQLEKLSFQEQIQLFHQAVLVIGQHGAGLANAIWMRPESSMIELSNVPKLVHFRNICQVMGHSHHLYPTDGAHVAIDIDDFSSWLSGEDGLEQLLETQ
ncbi:hypothetical protein Pan258_18900 [Symmachiella dynata]|uniref:glycosyltransferase family 61 protein n=1 Tax=Symmachiella dynata TaxID=2527995 RepID=UPI00118BEEF7|nr:glycosyltransferase family 61 protein [Symmachiella dynata]QDT47851.1 hypothetical protein Pan258_18900 [Symmachiella dynata]